MNSEQDNIRYLSERVKRLHDADRTSFDGGGGGGYDDGMDARVKKLEELAEQSRTELREIDVRLTKIEARLDQTATRSDVTDAVNGQIKWIVGTAVALGASAITVMTFVLNNAVPKPLTQPAAQPTPIIITVPATAATAPSAAPK